MDSVAKIQMFNDGGRVISIGLYPNGTPVQFNDDASDAATKRHSVTDMKGLIQSNRSAKSARPTGGRVARSPGNGFRRRLNPLIAMFAPDEGAGLTRSVVDGFGWGSAARSPTAFSATGGGEGPRG